MQVSYSAPLHIVEARKIVPVYCLTKLCCLEGRKRWEMSTLHVGILEGKKECGAAGSSHTLSFGVGWGIDIMTFEKLCTPFQQPCHSRPLYVILERAQPSLWSNMRE